MLTRLQAKVTMAVMTHKGPLVGLGLQLLVEVDRLRDQDQDRPLDVAGAAALEGIDVETDVLVQDQPLDRDLEDGIDVEVVEEGGRGHAPDLEAVGIAKCSLAIFIPRQTNEFWRKLLIFMAISNLTCARIVLS